MLEGGDSCVGVVRGCACNIVVCGVDVFGQCFL